MKPLASKKPARSRKPRSLKPAEAMAEVSDANPALTLDPRQGGSDYTLRPGATGCWVTVGNVSVHLVREIDGTGVRVDLLKKDAETEDPIDTAFAPFALAEPTVAEVSTV